jgi:hypothetical protein
MPRKGKATDRKQICGCQGLGVGPRERLLMTGSFFSGWFKCSEIRVVTVAVNILKATEIHPVRGEVYGK